MKTFAQELGKILFTDTFKNSYYNDQYDINCLTPNYNDAYKLLISKKEITQGDFESTYSNTAEGDSKEVEFSGLDLVKMAAIGDFDQDFNDCSSKPLNLKCLLALSKSIQGETIWEQQAPRKDEEETHEMETNEWRKENLRSTSLSEIVYRRVLTSALKRDAEEIKLCRLIAKNLKKLKSFGPNKKDKPKGKELQEKYDGLDNKEDKKNFLKELKKMAGYSKNGKVTEIYNSRFSSPNSIRQATIRHYVFEDSNDELFEKIAKTIKGTKEKVMDAVREEKSSDLS